MNKAEAVLISDETTLIATATRDIRQAEDIFVRLALGRMPWPEAYKILSRDYSPPPTMMQKSYQRSLRQDLKERFNLWDTAGPVPKLGKRKEQDIIWYTESNARSMMDEAISDAYLLRNSSKSVSKRLLSLRADVSKTMHAVPGADQRLIDIAQDGFDQGLKSAHEELQSALKTLFESRLIKRTTARSLAELVANQ